MYTLVIHTGKPHLSIDCQLWTVFEMVIFSRGLSGLSSKNADIIRVVVGRGNITKLTPSPRDPVTPLKSTTSMQENFILPFSLLTTRIPPETSQYAYCDCFNTLAAAYGFHHVHRVANLFLNLFWFLSNFSSLFSKEKNVIVSTTS